MPAPALNPRFAPWLFGKLPAHGDFVSRGCDESALEAADATIAEGLQRAIDRWDDRWDDVYVDTPVWRFVAAPGAIFRDWLAGVFVPSIDAVGRQFPLLAGVSTPSLALAAWADRTEAFLAGAEERARDALLSGLDADALLDALAAEAAAAFGATRAPSSSPVASLMRESALRLEAAAFDGASIWWFDGAGRSDWSRGDGLLSAEFVAGLFRPGPAARAAQAEGEPEVAAPEDAAVAPTGEPPAAFDEAEEIERTLAALKAQAALAGPSPAEAVEAGPETPSDAPPEGPVPAGGER